MHVGRDGIRRAIPQAFVPGLAVRHLDAPTARLTLRICNHAHIERAYGVAVAEGVVTRIQHRLAGALPVAADIAVRPNGVLTVALWTDRAVGGDVVDALLPEWLTAFCTAAMHEPVTIGAVAICVWLSGDWVSPARQGMRICPFCGPPIGEEIEAGAHYRADMAIVANLLPSLLRAPSDTNLADEPAPVLYWQPVVNDSGAILYDEALCRPRHSDDGVVPPEPLLRALERLGFACVLDRFVVSAVIDALEAAPDVTLAANVSAQSLSCAPSWGDVLARLKQRPDVARRLIWEITETAIVRDMEQATSFVSTLRALGCRIAIDDFGVGNASIGHLLAFSPDIIKIDRLFLDRATASARDAAIFRQLVELARSFDAEVVAEGVETRLHADLVASTGAAWQQGYFHARPSPTRWWRREREPRAPGALMRRDGR